jgi:hypothetical protein
LEASSSILGLIIMIFFIAMGASIIASGQLFLAIREIALNTRKEENEAQPSYSVLLTVAKINNFLGWLLIIAGVVAAVLIARGGGRSNYWGF